MTQDEALEEVNKAIEEAITAYGLAETAAERLRQVAKTLSATGDDSQLETLKRLIDTLKGAIKAADDKLKGP